MKRLAIALALCAAALAQEAPKPPASVKVTRLDAPRALKFEIVVPAKLDDVWTAFTTSAGL
ncbi:MAG TPA: SRPBCC domain-containing protein, partial [Candidatus Solibacter sp.]